MKRSPWCNDCGFLSKIARGVLLTQRGSTLPINTQGLQDTLQRMPHCWMLALTNQSKYLPCPLPFSPSDNTRKEQRIRGERNDVRVILVLPPPFSPFVPLRMQSIPNPSWDFLQSIASNPYASAIATVTSSNQHEHPFHLEGDLQWWGSFIQHTLLISLLKSSLQTTRNSPSVKFPVFQCWALFQLNIWKSHSESLLKNNYSHYHLGSDPVVCTLTQMVFYEGRFVCSGVFFFFSQGEFFSGNFTLVFQHCFHSSWRAEAAVLSLVNKKAKPQSPATRTNTPSCCEGSPVLCTHGRAVVAEEAVVCFLITALSFMQKSVHKCISGFLSKEPFSWIYWLCL